MNKKEENSATSNEKIKIKSKKVKDISSSSSSLNSTTVIMHQMTGGIFFQLDINICHEILSYLNAKELGSFAMTNKYNYTDETIPSFLWKNLLNAKEENIFTEQFQTLDPYGKY
jgi:hypothetical protein